MARMALAAMDSSESVQLPLDYLQGHKDGLEWAARLAEANHPETGDWLYDDPIELAKAIRKGPDMPPVQPVADSDPDRNPVLAYADSYRDMAKQGVESVPIWSVITDIERNIAPLYRHAQPAPVVPDDVLAALQKVARIRLDMNDFDGDRRGIADCLCDAEEALIEVVNRRAAMLQAAPVCTCPSGDGSLRWPCPVHPGNSPVIPDSSADMLRRWLAFGRGMQNAGSQLPHNLIAETESMLAAAPQSPGIEPATVPGKWIPVSERMPDENAEQQVLACFKGGDISTLYYLEGRWDDAYGIVPIRQDVTHWMPLPAGPKEDIKALIPLVSRNEQEVK
ncbi:DUF551 domain-containing protein [Klebsiella quasipneumoniae]|uniref:DUF551 domain-containing protein n=1 Tax=Klebsiella quasipneumoniae TaxID=1463165 RepID=UPI003877C12C